MHAFQVKARGEAALLTWMPAFSTARLADVRTASTNWPAGGKGADVEEAAAFDMAGRAAARARRELSAQVLPEPQKANASTHW